MYPVNDFVDWRLESFYYWSKQRTKTSEWFMPWMEHQNQEAFIQRDRTRDTNNLYPDHTDIVWVRGTREL